MRTTKLELNLLKMRQLKPFRPFNFLFDYFFRSRIQL